MVGLLLQYSTRRYRAFAYWFLAFAIAIFGTGVADFLHLDVGLSYAETAEVCDCPVGTVRSRVARAREAVIRELAAGESATHDGLGDA